MISNIRIALFLILGAMVILLATCRRFLAKNDDSVIDDLTDDELEETDDEFLTDIINIPGHEFLYYSLSTREVYGLSIEDDGEYFESFISNEHLCKYIKGRIVEVVDDEVVAIVHSATLPD